MLGGGVSLTVASPDRGRVVVDAVLVPVVALLCILMVLVTVERKIPRC